MEKNLCITLCLTISCLMSGYSQSQTSELEEARSCLSRFDTLHQRAVYYLVDEPPVYPGGKMVMLSTLMQHCKYPGPSCCIAGRVVVSIVVEKDGSVIDRKILRGFGLGVCSPDDEVMKAFTYLKKWQSGKCDGEAVPVQLVLPIQLCLE